VIRKALSAIYRWWDMRYEVYDVRTGQAIVRNLKRIEVSDVCADMNEHEMYYGIAKSAPYRWRVEQ
jgi:hypothetical protein